MAVPGRRGKQNTILNPRMIYSLESIRLALNLPIMENNFASKPESHHFRSILLLGKLVSTCSVKNKSCEPVLMAFVGGDEI